MSNTEKIATGVKWATIGTISQAVFGVLKLSVLTRFLDRGDFGLMAILTMVIGFVDLFSDMGISSAIIHKQNISKNEYASLYWLNMAVSLLLFLVVVMLTPIISDFYSLPSLQRFIPILSTNVIISSIGRQFKTIENKHMQFKEVAIIDLVSGAMSFILALILAINNFGILSLIYSTIAQYVLSNLLFLIQGLKKHGLLLHYSFKETKPFLEIGMYQVGGQIINFFNRDLDILIIGKLFSSEILGSYNLAKQLVFRPTQIINPVLTKVATPALAKIQHNLLGLRKMYLRIVNIVAYLNVIVYGGLIVAAPWIIQIFYGNGYENIVSLVRILSCYMILRGIGNPIGSLTTATGKTRTEFYWNALTLILVPIFILIGAQQNIIGVAVSLFAAHIVLFIPFWIVLVRQITGASLIEYVSAILDLGLLKDSITKSNSQVIKHSPREHENFNL